MLPMNDPLATYVHDHLAGSSFAIDLLGSLQDNYSEDQLGVFAANLLVEIEKDRQTLQRIVDRVGKEPPDLKEAAAWLMEKVSRLKLGLDKEKRLNTLQGLETLELGILGKLALWRALVVTAEFDDRLQGIDFGELITRAQAQHDEVEQQRLQIVRVAFSERPQKHKKQTQS
jgi:hypothetical protein